MNHFFALEVPPEVRQYIQQEVVSLWKPALKESTGWYASEDYHVTLKFLGDVAKDRQPRLISAGNSVVAAMSPFTLTLAPPGAFPENRSKRIFWMGVLRSEEINDLAGKMDNACHALGYLREQRLYTPHITVARLGRGKGRESDGCIPRVDERLFPIWQADHFVLMQTLPPESRANGAKARYNLVHTFPFGNPPSDVS